ncbi:MAG: bifunctional (p)ppGpp synthetase/guanosine-3',5'-bis(diphosphate) 3'-pyrophosphohydrolase [Myxococcales bacterium]|nr:bifunctional (p)ppGpp synthetase/guanosine-3',5'-bis(diphosphate) 3'-pyrophosphohydrolase [Myxococcales bacterium]
MSDLDPGELLAALELAAHKHRDQRRKDEAASPYINHPLAVVHLLWAHGVRHRVPLLAAVLHDTIEDTDTTRDELVASFGDAVASVVCEVTDDKSLPKEERKQLQIEHAPHLSAHAKLVKLADKICNLRDLTDSPPANWPAERRAQYFVWAKAVVAGLRGTNAGLEAAFDAEHARGTSRP